MHTVNTRALYIVFVSPPQLSTANTSIRSSSTATITWWTMGPTAAAAAQVRLIPRCLRIASLGTFRENMGAIWTGSYSTSPVTIPNSELTPLRFPPQEIYSSCFLICCLHKTFFLVKSCMVIYSNKWNNCMPSDFAVLKIKGFFFSLEREVVPFIVDSEWCCWCSWENARLFFLFFHCRTL